MVKSNTQCKMNFFFGLMHAAQLSYTQAQMLGVEVTCGGKTTKGQDAFGQSRARHLPRACALAKRSMCWPSSLGLSAWAYAKTMPHGYWPKAQHQVGPERIELTGVEFAAPPCAIATLLARPCGLSPQASTLCAGRLFPASPRIPLHALPNSSRYQLLSSLGCISVPRGAPLLTRCAL